MTQSHKSGLAQVVKIWNSFGRKLPVDVGKIAQQLKIEIVDRELEDDISGMMVSRDDGSAFIVVNKSHSEHRQRFTIAHELGHYIMHRSTSPVFVDGGLTVFYRDSASSAGTHLQEIEANGFAAELLMPENELRKCLPSRLSLMDTTPIEQAATLLNVSTAAITYRLFRLGLIDSLTEVVDD